MKNLLKIKAKLINDYEWAIDLIDLKLGDENVLVEK